MIIHELVTHGLLKSWADDFTERVDALVHFVLGGFWMVSKNNHKFQQYRQEDKKQRFALRKLTIGVASVLLGTTFAIGGTVAHADEVTPSTTTPETEQTAANGDEHKPQSGVIDLNVKQSSIATPAESDNNAKTSASSVAVVQRIQPDGATKASQSSTSASNEANAEQVAQIIRIKRRRLILHQ